MAINKYIFTPKHDNIEFTFNEVILNENLHYNKRKG